MPISSKQLSALCRRVGLALESGIEERKVWQREADRARGSTQSAIIKIHEAVAAGDSASHGAERSGRYFPSLFHELVQLGEKTGKSAAIFRRLADHYEHRLKLRRAFLAGITWPIIQLVAAIIVVGLLIWILGLIGGDYDALGLGLQGNSGLLIYVLVILGFAAMGLAIYLFIRSGAAWTRPAQLATIRLPGIGRCVETLCLAKISWSLGLSLEAGMDVRKAVPFGLQTAGNYHFSRHIPDVSAALDQGDDVFSALAKTGVFPDDFLDVVQVGEQSGRLDESMLHLAEQYLDRARAALATLTVLAGFAVWAMVVLMIAAIIISIVNSYTNMIQDLANPRNRR